MSRRFGSCSRGAQINARQVEGCTALYQATVLGGGLQVLRLLLENGADPNITSVVGQPPLSVAALRGDIAAMQALIAKGAKVTVANGAGDTPLMGAATSGNPAAVRLLLEHGADATARSKRNETALGNAATAGNEDSITRLLAHGADVNIRNFRGIRRSCWPPVPTRSYGDREAAARKGSGHDLLRRLR